MSVLGLLAVLVLVFGLGIALPWAIQYRGPVPPVR